MVRTDQAYINEYLVYDEVFEACEACERACVEADYFMMKQARRDYLDAYFSEAMNFGKKKEDKTENNIFAKIGKAIVNLINKIKAVIKKITDALVGDRKRTEKANSAIQKIISDNPELKKQIINGVKKNWFTIYDVAAYKNDVVSLINMLDQAKIDNQTAFDKFKEMSAKVAKGTMSTIAGTGGLLGIAKFLNEIMKSRKEVSDNLSTMQKMAEVIQIQDHQKGKNPDGLSTKLRILSGAVQVLVGFDKKYVDAYDALNKTIDKYNAEEATAAKAAEDAKKKAFDDQVAKAAAEEAAAKKARDDSIKATNGNFETASREAQSLINRYNANVEKLVNYAMTHDCADKVGKDRYTYGGIRDSIVRIFDRLDNTYSDYCDNLKRSNLDAFFTMVDNDIRNVIGTLKRGVKNDCINKGKFIVYIPNPTHHGKDEKSNNGQQKSGNRQQKRNNVRRR